MRCKPIKIILIIFLGAFLASYLFAQKKFKESELPQKYQEWLNLVAYIILPQEKEIFSSIRK